MQLTSILGAIAMLSVAAQAMPTEVGVAEAGAEVETRNSGCYN